VNDDDGREPVALRGAGEQPADRAVAARRLHGDPLGPDARVVGGDLLRPRVVRPQRLEQHRRRHAADGEGFRAVEERPAVDVAVLVEVEQIEQFLRKLGGLPAFHGGLLVVTSGRTRYRRRG